MKSAVLLMTLLLHFSGVLSEDVQDLCKFADDESEFAVKQGKAKIAPLIGKRYRSSQTTEETTYVYDVGICTNPYPDQPNPGMASVMQQEMANGQAKPGTAPRKIGSLQSVYIMSGTDWAVLEYRGGEDYDKSCNKEGKRSVIMLQCDQYIDDESAELVFLKEEKQRERECYYLFELKHQALCVETSSSSGLSVGSILVIVFFCVAAVYLLVGFLYSRFVLGAKGKEQIPNYDFWKDFGNLQADGCNFVCRTQDRERSRGFGGIGDEQLDPTEEIRDDNLLPM